MHHYPTTMETTGLEFALGCGIDINRAVRVLVWTLFDDPHNADSPASINARNGIPVPHEPPLASMFLEDDAAALLLIPVVEFFIGSLNLYQEVNANGDLADTFMCKIESEHFNATSHRVGTTKAQAICHAFLDVHSGDNVREALFDFREVDDYGVKIPE